jgi:hypothetical protein
MTKAQIDRNLKLAKALESGKYSQCRGSLRENNSYCCLGVACDLYRHTIKHTRKRAAWSKNPDGTRYMFLGESDFAPLAVAKWFGWRHLIGFLGENDLLGENDPMMAGQRMSVRNDHGQSFKRIGTAIRAEMKRQATSVWG